MNSNWILTFILGFIAGVLGWHTFIMIAGKRAHERRMAKMKEAAKGFMMRPEITGIFDDQGNEITPDNPLYEKIIEDFCRDTGFPRPDLPQKPDHPIDHAQEPENRADPGEK